MLQVIDKTGWHKAFQLTKAISYIGSDPANDVVLESWRGAGVAHRHLQVISLPGGGYRLVNLSSTPIVLAGREPRTVPPHSFADVLANERFELGEFTLLLGGSDDEHTQSSQSVSSWRRRDPKTAIWKFADRFAYAVASGSTSATAPPTARTWKK